MGMEEATAPSIQHQLKLRCYAKERSHSIPHLWPSVATFCLQMTLLQVLKQDSSQHADVFFPVASTHFQPDQ